MRFAEIIARDGFVSALKETLDKPLPYTWVEQTEQTYRATFEIDGLAYWVKIYRTQGQIPPDNHVARFWVINFGIDPEVSKKLHGHEYAIMKPTGINRGTSGVLSTVLAAVDEFIRHVRPAMIWFSDNDHLAQRGRLYQKFAERLIRQFPYEFDAKIMRHFSGEPVWCLRRLALQPSDARFSLTGAWVESHGGGGCVASVQQVLSKMKFKADVRDSALDLDAAG